MKPRSSATARIFAATALVVAFVLAIAVIGGGLGGGGSSGSGKGGHASKAAHRQAAKKRHVPATYEIQSGDTLVSIAHRTGVPVVRIEALNPQVDPQILIAGEKLKLR
jgi:nucleoid-associated protein YgaU